MPKPVRKPRILTPEAAKDRAYKPSQFPSEPIQSPPSQPQPPTSSNTAPRNPRFSPLSFLRTRYASLPQPARRTLRTLKILAPILPIGLFIREHVLQAVYVNGPSMTPYLNEEYETTHTQKDWLLVSMWPFGGAGWGLPWGKERGRRLERGMIVMFRSPADSSHLAIKRIIGLPGDRITTREPCAKESQIVPFNHVWVEGDAQDPKKSLDSNTYGPVSISLIAGRAIAVVSPKLRWLDWTAWEKGVVEGDTEGRFGEEYRKEVRERVIKEAVKLERPFLT
ncbi:peptidase S24/S26A/S26B/S26C [Aspergillus karnatakaensis]|uniref:putative mitochondrial inner membrane protease subunit Imp2 n=1 Tax=Aspergillus karnatakaensis TaxID=1810916 RepID=UPI003CCCDE77